MVSAVDQSEVNLIENNEDLSSNYDNSLTNGEFRNCTPFIIHTDRINRASMYPCNYSENNSSSAKSFKALSTTQVQAVNGDVQSQENVSASTSNTESSVSSDPLKEPAESLKTNVESSENIDRLTTAVTYLDTNPAGNVVHQREPVLVMTTVYDSGMPGPLKLLDEIELSQMDKGDNWECFLSSDKEQNGLEKPVDEGEQDTLPASRAHFGSLCQIKDIEETKPFPNDQRAHECEEFSLTSGVIKRSSSLISDSGIESEPSSVAWSDARSKALELPSDREIVHQLVRRHGVHRNSLEGGHTESNTSLPSGIQASLTSISSLPYEEEEREVEPNKLTKSISAPQISSPEEPVGDLNIARHTDIVEGQYVEIDGVGVGGDSTSNSANVSTDAVGCPESALEQNGSRFHLLKEDEQFSKIGCNLEAAKEPGLLQQNLDLNGTTKSQWLEREREDHMGGVSDCLDTNAAHVDAHVEEAKFHPGQSLCAADIKAFPHCEKQGPDLCDSVPPSSSVACESVSAKGRCETLLANGKIATCGEDILSLQEIELGDSSRHGPENRQLKTVANSTGFHFVVPEKKKATEVVNLSVSCTATCLPFSSVLKEAPPVVGFSSKQASSPITHQPVGSFGVISCESSEVDQKSNERMLR